MVHRPCILKWCPTKKFNSFWWVFENSLAPHIFTTKSALNFIFSIFFLNIIFFGHELSIGPTKTSQLIFFLNMMLWWSLLFFMGWYPLYATPSFWPFRAFCPFMFKTDSHLFFCLSVKEAKAREGALERFIRFSERSYANSSGVISAGVLFQHSPHRPSS